MHAFARLTSFLLFVLSLSFLACALPTPANTGLKEVATRDVGADAIVAAVAKLNVDLSVHLNAMVQAAAVTDVKTAAAVVVADVQACVDALVIVGANVEVDAAIKADIVVKVVACISLIVKACLSLLLKFGLSVISVIFIQLDVCLKALLVQLDVCVAGMVAVILDTLVKAQADLSIKVFIQVHLHLCAGLFGLVSL